VNHYEVLGVAPDASLATIKAAYRRLSKLHHPDRPHGDTEKMTAITKAYSILKDPEKRARYDRTGQDNREDTIEHAAMSMLADAFGQYLDHGNDTENPLAQIRAATKDAQGKTRQSLHAMRLKLAKLEMRATVVKRKKTGGNDIYASVLATKKKEMNAKIDGAETFIKQADMVLAILDEYECTIIEIPKSQTKNCYGVEQLFGWKEI